MTPQDIANKVGAGLRNTEAAVAQGNTETAATHLAQLHAALVEAFTYCNAKLDLGLSMDEITGNSAKTSRFHTDGGGPKDD